MFIVQGSRILVRPNKPEQYYGKDVKLIVPEAYQVKGQFGWAFEGTIEQIGDIDRTIYPEDLYSFKEGQEVIIGRYVGIEIKINDKPYRIVNPDEILATIEQI